MRSERCRLRVCWGNYEGPHHRDIPLEAIAGVLKSAKPRGLPFEAANPRHANEWTVFRDRAGRRVRRAAIRVSIRPLRR